MQFKVRVKKHSVRIPNSMYPVASEEKCALFNADNCSERIQHSQLEDALNKRRFDSGHCYENAADVCEIGKELGLQIEFWAGWTLLGHEIIHHAWNVYDGKIIDVSNSIFEWAVMKTTFDNYSGIPEGLNRKYAENLQKGQKVRPATTNDSIFGFIPSRDNIGQEEERWLYELALDYCKEYKYIGSPDEPLEALLRIKMLINRYPNHPAFKYKGGKTNLQREIDLAREQSSYFL